VRANAKLALTLPNVANIYGVKFTLVKLEKKHNYEFYKQVKYDIYRQ